MNNGNTQSKKEAQYLKELTKIAGAALAEFSNRRSLITITNIRTEHKGRTVVFGVSVLPESQEHAALDFLNRKRRDIGHRIAQAMRHRMAPRISFEVDMGEKHRQRIDEISREEIEE